MAVALKNHERANAFNLVDCTLWLVLCSSKRSVSHTRCCPILKNVKYMIGKVYRDSEKVEAQVDGLYDFVSDGKWLHRKTLLLRFSCKAVRIVFSYDSCSRIYFSKIVCRSLNC